jgi:molybdate transport system permease protein
MSSPWPPMLLSLKVALVATLLVASDRRAARVRHGPRRFVGKSVLDALIVVPLVLPPTVVGYLISSRSARVRRSGAAAACVRLLAAVPLARRGARAVIVAMPLLYLPAKAAFASVDREMEDLARLLGRDAAPDVLARQPAAGAARDRQRLAAGLRAGAWASSARR